jgi:tRNA U34 5-methylaminomethyl-2-thiouridine-forming methyltransferase MnmC
VKRSLQTTADGSHTLVVDAWGEGFHSHHGAIQESLHVFIQHGLLARSEAEIDILEIGFGTGLNAWLTAIHAENKHIRYLGVEGFPVQAAEWESLNYAARYREGDFSELFNALHNAEWGNWQRIRDNFELKKVHALFEDFDFRCEADLIYMDAFAPRHQPEFWNDEFFKELSDAMRKGACLLTYSSKGDVRRAMQAAGLAVEKLPGPPGKREMVRAWKR